MTGYNELDLDWHKKHTYQQSIFKQPHNTIDHVRKTRRSRESLKKKSLEFVVFGLVFKDLLQRVRGVMLSLPISSKT